MRYKYTFKKKPNMILGVRGMLLAMSEYGIVQYTEKALIVYTGKITRYEYSYEQNVWDKIVGATKTYNVKPPVLDVDVLDVDNALFFTMTTEASPKEYYRKRREEVCYPVINRGQLWYNHLTLAQKAELNDWYEAWLDATETLVIPSEPAWLNDKLNKIEPEELL